MNYANAIEETDSFSSSSSSTTTSALLFVLFSLSVISMVIYILQNIITYYITTTSSSSSSSSILSSSTSLYNNMIPTVQIDFNLPHLKRRICILFLLQKQDRRMNFEQVIQNIINEENNGEESRRHRNNYNNNETTTSSSSSPVLFILVDPFLFMSILAFYSFALIQVFDFQEQVYQYLNNPQEKIYI